MNNLQTSLLAIGGLVVFGVVAFNWFQERGFRRRTEKAFNRNHDDVLLAKKEIRVEEPPHNDQPENPILAALTNNEPIRELASKPIEVSTPDSEQWCDPVIDYVIDLKFPDVVAADSVNNLLREAREIGKPISSCGLNSESGKWEGLELNSNGFYREIKTGIQLANRNGPISSAQLSNFRDVVKNLGVQTNAQFELPDHQEALSKAAELDRFCADVDISVVFNVISRSGGMFAGTKIRALAEALGFKLEPNGEFRFFDDRGHTLFVLANHEPTKFIPEEMKSISTKCFTLTLEVPLVTDGLKVFDQLVQMSKNMTSSLGGLLVDDNYVPLNDQGIEKTRQQLEKTYAAMDIHQTYPGSPRAVRLFS